MTTVDELVISVFLKVITRPPTEVFFMHS